MALFGSDVECATHTLLALYMTAKRASSAELAAYQGLSPSQVAKVLSLLQRAGLVSGAAGRSGGYLLSKAAKDISVADIVDAVQGVKPLFACKEVRQRCVLFEKPAPKWATSGSCSINKVFLDAENAMRRVLAGTSLATIARSFKAKAPIEFKESTEEWFRESRSDRVDTPRTQ